MTQHVKPLPGQMPLFDDMPTANAEEIQRRAAKRNDEQCAWGDCTEPATHTRHNTDERFCRLHIQWTLSA